MNDAMYLIMWVRNFLEAQGYTVRDNIVYQDNQSAMLLEKNGRKSSTKNTRHMDIRYFFITDTLGCKSNWIPMDWKATNRLHALLSNWSRMDGKATNRLNALLDGYESGQRIVFGMDLSLICSGLSIAIRLLLTI